MAHLQFMPGDQRLVDQLVCELKSKGIFDQFRKECIADVDTRPAYQNLRQRVESSVSTFLARQKWRPDLNKNQLRDKLRKHILDGNYLEQGVERIVDQVVNPKVASVFIPQVEDLVYNYLGIKRNKSISATETSNGKVECQDLLPTDLEAVSPGSVKSNDDKEDAMDTSSRDDKEMKMDIDENSVTKSEIKEDSLKSEPEKDQDTQLSGISELTSHDSGSVIFTSIPLPAEIKPENIPPPENSPPKIVLEKIELPKDSDIPLPSEILPPDIPLPDDIPMPDDSEQEGLFKPIINPSEEDDSSSDSSLIRNMSPLTPVRNFDDENSCDAQQAFDNHSELKDDQKDLPVSTFRFTIESKSPESSTDGVKSVETKQNVPSLTYQFENQVNINTATPLYDESSNSNNLHIDYESDANSKFNTDSKQQEQDQTANDVKKEKPNDKKNSHKSSHRSRDSHRHSSSSKDKRSDSKQSSSRDRRDKQDKKSSKDHKSDRSSSKSKSSNRERSHDRSDKKDSRESSKHRHSSTNKSSISHKDSKTHRSSSSSQKHASSKSSDDKKSSSSSSHRDRNEKSSSRNSKSSKDSRSSSHRSDKDKKSSSDKNKDDKNKDKKDKTATDDHYGLSGRGNINRRSTDRDSNDGNSTSSKGSNKQPSSKSAESKKEKSSSKSGSTSSSDTTSPCDKELIASSASNESNIIQQVKPIVRIDTHLEVAISQASPVRFMPEVVLKKPKFASNLEEAKKMMKMRKFLDEEQKRMNQEAALLLEFQANVRPSLSQVYSSIPGPEMEFAFGSNVTEDKVLENDQLTNTNDEQNVFGNGMIMNNTLGTTQESQNAEKSVKMTMSTSDVETSTDNTTETKCIPEFQKIVDNEQTKEESNKIGDAEVKAEKHDFEVTIITEDISESEDTSKTFIKKDLESIESKHADTAEGYSLPSEEEGFKYFGQQEQYDAELERDQFAEFVQRVIKSQTKKKIFLLNCDTFEVNIFKEVCVEFGDYEVVNYPINGYTLPKTDKDIDFINNEVTLTMKTIKQNNTSPKRSVESSPVFSPVKSECSFDLSSDYNAKLEDMANNTTRQEIMEIILGSVVDCSPTKMPKIDICSELNIESCERTPKRKHSEDAIDNNNRQVLTANKIRKLSGSDQISSTTEETEEVTSNKSVNSMRSKYLGKAKRVGLSRPRKTNLPNSPSSDKSVENYEQEIKVPNSPVNGIITRTVRSKGFTRSDLYKPKLHYLSRRKNVT